MKYTPRQYATALHECLKTGKGKQAELLKKFAELVKKRNDGKLKNAILREFAAIFRTAEGVKEVLITAAREDTAAVAAALIREELGGKTEITKSIKPELAGGITIRLGDVYLDGSLSRRLQVLKNAFCQ